MSYELWLRNYELWDWNIVLSPVRCPWGFRSWECFCKNQNNEIHNFITILRLGLATDYWIGAGWHTPDTWLTHPRHTFDSVAGPWSLGPWSLVQGPGPWYLSLGFRNIVLSWMRCFGGLVSSQRYRPNQQLEIYTFWVVPVLQISKDVVFLLIYMRVL